jgi:nucleoside-diphosphate-sugar epimerase
MASPILVTGAAGRIGGVGRTVTELLLKQGKAVRAIVLISHHRTHRFALLQQQFAGH